jgi:dolichyl-phosphate-mannose-protein mannosyltransferase
MNHVHKSEDGRSVGHAQDKARQKQWVGVLSWFLVVAGLLVRVAQWLSNRSLWHDEAMLARNIIDRSPLELLAPLDYHQGAPVLFLLLVDAATSLFGLGERSLRLIPLLSSLLGLVLFFLIARLFLETRYVPIAVLLFVLSYRLMYYAQEIKQYSVDVTIAIVLTYFFLRLLESNSPRNIHLICLGVLGSVATFLSHPSVFVLASIASTLIALRCCKHLSVSFRSLILVIGSWVVGLGANYIFFLRSLSANETLLTYWRGGFLPLPISTGAVRVWWETAGDFLSYSGFPVQWHIFVLALVAVAVGSGIRSRSAPMLMIAMCFFYAFGTSVLGKYPFATRLALYAVPLLILSVVKGLEAISRRSAPVYFIFVLALIAPSIKSLPTLLRPIQRAEVRSLLRYLDLNRQPGDHVYVSDNASHAVKYYRRNNAPEKDYWHFGAPWTGIAGYIDDIRAMKEWPRVWFVFAHTRDIEDVLVSHIDGMLLQRHAEFGASLYLYSFKQPNANKAMDGDEK